MNLGVSYRLYYVLYIYLHSCIDHRPHHLVRQDTPMPRKEITPTDGFQNDRTPSLPQYQPQVILADEIYSELSGSPVQLSSSPSENILSQLDEAIDTLNKPMAQRPRPESGDSLLYCNDFGMNDLMVMIRGAASVQEKKLSGRSSSRPIRSEISEVFSDSQTRLDQLEKVGLIFLLFVSKEIPSLMFHPF